MKTDVVIIGAGPAGIFTALEMLRSGSKHAGEISEKFDITAAAISRHLSVLKDADLIRDQRDGKFIIYTLNTSVLEDVLFWVSNLKGE